ncbi:pyridoxamine 5'-phosphate oxidase family protein [Ktedonospora formicarum]|uniref:Pyridoxamine 5'-phosphate oxidase N-terminal domain-containing protein n=1 Tax=Ktedonospora formicarum TaxID=2778364 RepID=A0A8J3I8R0_9CHLR|nr:pyridoxamine 5'-phosphate oxidase family protein [Ktedonospora formicarum]GHO48097.1 hypothetical protein KSX_62600 [Ktedonospora formicarum]
MADQHLASEKPEFEKAIRHREVPFALPDATTPDGQRILKRLRDEQTIWFTTVDEEGSPHALPVAFVWDEARGTLLTYSAPQGERDRLEHIARNPHVGLHFEMGHDADLLVMTGEASVSRDDPPSNECPAWVEKYRDYFARLGMSLARAAEAAPVSLRIRPQTLRYMRSPF